MPRRAASSNHWCLRPVDDLEIIRKIRQERHEGCCGRHTAVERGCHQRQRTALRAALDEYVARVGLRTARDEVYRPHGIHECAAVVVCVAAAEVVAYPVAVAVRGLVEPPARGARARTRPRRRARVGLGTVRLGAVTHVAHYGGPLSATLGYDPVSAYGLAAPRAHLDRIYIAQASRACAVAFEPVFGGQRRPARRACAARMARSRPAHRAAREHLVGSHAEIPRLALSPSSSSVAR